MESDVSLKFHKTKSETLVKFSVVYVSRLFSKFSTEMLSMFENPPSRDVVPARFPNEVMTVSTRREFAA